jgi:hypothetical protein
MTQERAFPAMHKVYHTIHKLYLVPIIHEMHRDNGELFSKYSHLHGAYKDYDLSSLDISNVRYKQFADFSLKEDLVDF